ncbi:MAG TPA: hypothetical protein VG297_03930 [Bryobacteraceae bacterium]|jgi:hypothetical protein|nr:hypothetical protein [Bryobacteraceae bacterium]
MILLTVLLSDPVDVSGEIPQFFLALVVLVMDPAGFSGGHVSGGASFWDLRLKIRMRHFITSLATLPPFGHFGPSRA